MIRGPMNSVKSAPRHWVPETESERALVREELEGVIGSSHFCNSKRYPALLRYVVEKTLAGHADQLKERTLGIDVFHRPADYDTNTDTVVRYTAGEVRKRLAVYYHERGEAPVQIALPAGSYVPEFLLCEPEEAGSTLTELAVQEPVAWETPETLEVPRATDGQTAIAGRGLRGRALRLAFSVMMILFALVIGWRLTHHDTSAVDAFWAPMLHERGATVLCVGGVTFGDNNFSGTHTAGKDVAYPFASMQIVSSVSQLSGLLERGGASYGVQAASTTQLSELREHPVVLLGGFNNEWTLRLVSPLRFHFARQPDEVILDSDRPGMVWKRDQGQGYGSADDYAIVARFRDTVTGSMIVVAAGLGRNGTELASQFLTSERYMAELRERLGGKMGSGNVEVLLRSRVIDGKTGAPQIEAVHFW